MRISVVFNGSRPAQDYKNAKSFHLNTATENCIVKFGGDEVQHNEVETVHIYEDHEE